MALCTVLVIVSINVRYVAARVVTCGKQSWKKMRMTPAARLDKEAYVYTFWPGFVVSSIWHSVKNLVLSSVWELDIRRRRQVCRVSSSGHLAKVLWPSLRLRVTFFHRASVLVFGKAFAECPIKNTRQRDVCRHCRWRVLFAEYKSFSKYFVDFAECCFRQW